MSYSHKNRISWWFGKNRVVLYLILGLSFLDFGCSIGTEVGNGIKPGANEDGGDNPETAAAKNNEIDSPSEPAAKDIGNGKEKGNDPTKPDSETDKVVKNPVGNESEVENGSLPAQNLPAKIEDHILYYLLTDCASPLKSSMGRYESAVGKLAFHVNPNSSSVGAFDVSDGKNTYSYAIDPNPLAVQGIKTSQPNGVSCLNPLQKSVTDQYMTYTQAYSNGLVMTWKVDQNHTIYIAIVPSDGGFYEYFYKAE